MDLLLFSKVAFCDWTVNLTAEFRRKLEIVKLRCNSRWDTWRRSEAGPSVANTGDTGHVFPRKWYSCIAVGLYGGKRLVLASTWVAFCGLWLWSGCGTEHPSAAWCVPLGCPGSVPACLLGAATPTWWARWGAMGFPEKCIPSPSWNVSVDLPVRAVTRKFYLCDLILFFPCLLASLLRMELWP